MKCSAVLTSEYGHIFSKLGVIPKDSLLDLPNAGFGLIFYTLFVLKPLFTAILGSAGSKMLFFVVSIAGVAISVVLFYVLRFILHDMCVLCVSTYVLNGLLASIAIADLFVPTKASKMKKLA
mmetsp:Transcript_8884/g.33535  ORF Transcript_8884/g.33535 Transcript_8884/m.33535 type:complete len:122 (-) Transcript_8884:78-443(-)